MEPLNLVDETEQLYRTLADRLEPGARAGILRALVRARNAGADSAKQNRAVLEALRLLRAVAALAK